MPKTSPTSIHATRQAVIDASRHREPLPGRITVKSPNIVSPEILNRNSTRMNADEKRRLRSSDLPPQLHSYVSSVVEFFRMG